MIKKIIVTLLLINTFLFSGNINLSTVDAFYGKTPFSGKNDLLITIASSNINNNLNPNPKDWVGVYKKGTSNAWGNVIKWVWARNIKSPIDGDGEVNIKGIVLKNANLQAGDYEVRYFLNNSYKTYKKSSFKVAGNAGNINLKAVTAGLEQNTLIISLEGHNFKANPKDWVGIYRKGTSNAWGNVKVWMWARDAKNPIPGDNQQEGRFAKLQNTHLQAGDYEVRYFLNNSFTTYKKSSFKVKGEAGNFNLVKVEAFYSTDRHETWIQLYHPKNEALNATEKDWVGVYKKGDSNAWGNVKIWTWVKNFGDKDIPTYIRYFDNTKLADGEYEVRYFRNNSFTTYMKDSFKVSNVKHSIYAGLKGNGDIRFTIESHFDKHVFTHKKDWVGIYRKGASNAWGNVKVWFWAKEFHKDKFGSLSKLEYDLKNANLPAGEYEVRYFKNNSFTTYIKNSFKIK